MDILAGIAEARASHLSVSRQNQIHSLTYQLTHIFSHELDGAFYLLTQLSSSSAPDNESSTALALLHLEYHLSNADYTAAMSLITKLSSTTSTSTTHLSPDITTQLHLLQYKSRIYIATSQPERAFTLAMRGASIAHSARLLPHLYTSLLHLSTVLTSLHEASLAINLLTSIAPLVSETSSVRLEAELHATLASAYMSLASNYAPDTTARKNTLTLVLENLGIARAGFQRLGMKIMVLEMCSKRAAVCYLQGDAGLAEDEASGWVGVMRGEK